MNDLHIIPGRFKLWALIVATIVFLAIDLFIISLLGADSTVNQSNRVDSGQMQWSRAFEEVASERARSEEALSELEEQLDATVRRVNREYLRREERFTEIERVLVDHAEQLRDLIEKSQPARQPQIGWRVEKRDLEELPETISLIVPGLFTSGSADMRYTGVKILGYFAQIILALPDREIEIVAHTDARGSQKYNFELSERRAEAVRNYLVGKYNNLQSKRLILIGRGESEPIADNTSVEGRHENRRIEVFLRR